MSKSGLEIIGHFKARKKDGETVDMTIYHIPIDNGAGSYMLVLDATDDIAVSETYMAPEFPKESVKTKFERRVREYLKSEELSRYSEPNKFL